VLLAVSQENKKELMFIESDERINAQKIFWNPLVRFNCGFRGLAKMCFKAISTFLRTLQSRSRASMEGGKKVKLSPCLTN
jgi:hypothetical protein